jgi:hypothetical protein
MADHRYSQLWRTTMQLGTPLEAAASDLERRMTDFLATTPEEADTLSAQDLERWQGALRQAPHLFASTATATKPPDTSETIPVWLSTTERLTRARRQKAAAGEKPQPAQPATQAPEEITKIVDPQQRLTAFRAWQRAQAKGA